MTEQRGLSCDCNAHVLQNHMAVVLANYTIPPHTTCGWAAGFKIVDSSKTPLDFSAMLYEMDRSVFCLAATGAGWGIRFKLAAMMRCIPVIIADGVQV
jgi:hypothetical protein